MCRRKRPKGAYGARSRYRLYLADSCWCSAVRRVCLPISRRTSRCRTKCMKRHVNSQSTRGAHATLTPVGSQELDKQNVDTNALLKLANTHVRAEPFVHVSAALGCLISAHRATSWRSCAEPSPMKRRWLKRAWSRRVSTSQEQHEADHASVAYARRPRRSGARIWMGSSASSTT